MVSLDFFVDI